MDVPFNRIGQTGLASNIENLRIQPPELAVLRRQRQRGWI